MVKVQVNWRIMGISSWQIQRCIFANPIWQSKLTRRYWVVVSEFEIWAYLFVANPQLLLADHWGSGTPLIHILKSRKLRHGSGILRWTAAFAAAGFPGIWLKFIHNWDLQSSPEWASWIYMKPTLTSCESLWIYHSSPGMPQEQQISHQSTSTFST